MIKKLNNNYILENEIKYKIINTGSFLGNIIRFYTIKGDWRECVSCFIQKSPSQTLSLILNYYSEDQMDLYETIINYIINNKIGTYDYTIFRTDRQKLKYDAIYFNVINNEILLKLL